MCLFEPVTNYVEVPSKEDDKDYLFIRIFNILNILNVLDYLKMKRMKRMNFKDVKCAKPRDNELFYYFKENQCNIYSQTN